jgi:succinate-acetate transporter protein
MAQYAAERSEAAATTANPAPLGLSAFALTTFVLSSANAGLFKGGAIVLGLALFYGGLGQIIAGVQEFRAGNTFGATAFCSYGGFWFAYGAILIPAFGIVAAYGGDTPAFHTAAGFFLLGWAIFTGFMFLGTLRTNLALMAVFGFLFLTFLSLAIGELAGAPAFGTLGGWLGIITALVAWYTAFAGVLASQKSMFTLPTWPRS